MKLTNPLQKKLWENIQHFAFDDPSSDFPFSKKLQQENHWNKDFTSRAIEEYRKFIFLCCILPNGASPSEAVDKVWHLHLTYTTNYWIEFCQKTLNKDIHHFPTTGGRAEKVKHTNWYQQTLQDYIITFGYEPPSTTWPTGQPFEDQGEVEIYETNFLKKIVVLFGVITLIYVWSNSLFRSTGEEFLFHYFILMIAGIAVSWILQLHKSKKLDKIIDENFPVAFSVYQIASFLYGTHRAYQTALIDLLKRDIIDTEGSEYKLTTHPVYDSEKKDNPLLATLTAKIAIGNTFTYQQGFELLDTAKIANPAFEHLAQISKKVDYQKFIIPGIVLAIGFGRLFQGLANSMPVNYLVFEIGLFTLISLMIAAEYSYTRLVFKRSERIWMNQNNNGRGSDILGNFSLASTAAIIGFAEYPILAEIFQRYSPVQKYSNGSWDYGSSGSDGSGGGCSSGCGGCGGCGGGD